MRVSELAKELGYRAAELLELAKGRGMPMGSVKDNVDARSAAAIRAQIPPRSKLAGAAKDLFIKIQADLAQRETEKESQALTETAEKPVREKKPAGPPKTRRVRKAPEAVDAATAATPPSTAPQPVAAPVTPAAAGTTAVPVKPKTVRKTTKVVAEFHLGAESTPQTEAPKPLPPKRKPAFTQEELKEIKATTAKPLIDVDKVIGQEKDVRFVRTVEADQMDRSPDADKERRRDKPGPQAPTGRPMGGRQPGGRPMGRPMGRDDASRFHRIKPPPLSRPTVGPPKPAPVQVAPEDRKYTIQVPITVKNLSQELSLKVADIVRKLMAMGKMATMNSFLDEDEVLALALECKRSVEVSRQKKAEETMVQEVEEVEQAGRTEDRSHRAPVVTVLGHVDHGKTTLLDRIRNTKVAAGEHGGITQHIGASRVKTASGKEIVFLDTPGHEAFTAMRARGAKVTDMVVLVVSAADGVMPQTEEAYNHAKAAGVPILIAMNKVDRPDANANKVKGQLSGIGLQTEDWGGQTVCVELSALTGHNVDKLVEMLLLEAELLDLKANPKVPARGAILEARRTDARGPVATLLVQEGTLRRGDVILTGTCYGRVRSMHNDLGESVDEAPPSTPVEVSGLNDVPEAGERFQVVADLSQAKDVVEERALKRKGSEAAGPRHVTLESLYSQIASGKLKDIKVLIKADTRGSLEVLTDLLQGLSTKEVTLSVLHKALGTISEADVLLADASDAIIIGFHVDPDDRAERLAKEKGVDIKLYQVVYDVLEDTRAALEGLLEPEKVNVTIGHLVVKEIFQISRIGSVAGCLVMDGKVERGALVRLIRNGKLVHEGKIGSLRRFKDDVKEVAGGYECGVKLVNHDHVLAGDVIEAYTIKEVARRLEKK